MFINYVVGCTNKGEIEKSCSMTWRVEAFETRTTDKLLSSFVVALSTFCCKYQRNCNARPLSQWKSFESSHRHNLWTSPNSTEKTSESFHSFEPYWFFRFCYVYCLWFLPVIWFLLLGFSRKRGQPQRHSRMGLPNVINIMNYDNLWVS